MSWIVKMIVLIVTRFKTLTTAEKFGVLTGGMSLTDTILTKIVGHDLKAEAFAVVVEEVAAKTGLALDPQDPFSDASMAGALSQRMGITIRSVKNREVIIEDIEDFAVGRVSEKLGFTITTLRDPVRMRQDFESAALNIITEKTGIPFVPPAAGEAWTVEEIKSQVEDWARARISTELAASANDALAVLAGEGVDFEAVAAEMNGKLQVLGSDETVSAGQLALRVAESLVQQSAAQFQKTAMGVSKKSRRQLQLREAQRKFRMAHGNRQVYVPLGMSANVS